MILSNANFSEDDKVLLERILDDLARKEIPTTMENIKEHSLFKKIDNKAAFEIGAAGVCSLSISVRQEKNNKDSLTIELKGTGLRLDDQVHSLFMNELSKKIGEKICYFVKGEEYFKAEHPDISNFLEQLKKSSCNEN